MLLAGLFAIASANVLQLKASPADSNLEGTYVVEYTSSSAHCAMFEPIFKEAVSKAAHLPVNVASINCDKYPQLCKYQPQDLPILEVWRNGREQELRPSTHSAPVLLEFLEKIAQGPLPGPYHEYDDEGNEAAERLSRKYEPYTQQQGVPIPVYPKPFDPKFGKGQVVLLNTENFEQTITNSGEPWMVKFYSPNCPYSKAMAAEWQRYTDSGLFNIAEFDCLQDINFCLANGVQFWPTIMYIDGNYRREYSSNLEIPQWESYHQMQSGGQIVPTKDLSDVQTLIDGAASKGHASFLYLHDDSTVFEDWNSLVNQGSIFADAQSVVFRASDPEVRKEVGPGYAGTNLVFAGKTVDNQDEDQYFYHVFDSGHEPVTIRDYDLVSKWVNQVRFSQPILLDKTQLNDINQYGDYHAILIAHNTRHDKFKGLRRAAHLAYEAGLEQQKKDHERLREIRKQMYQELKAQKEVKQYRKVYNTPIEVPFRGNISYSYIPKEQWDAQFGNLIDTSNHENGDIVLVNFAQNLYADSIDGTKLESFDPEVLGLSAKQMLGKSGLRPVERQPVDFVVKFDVGDRLARMGPIKWVAISGLAVIAALVLVRVALKFRVRSYEHVPEKLD